MLHTEEDATFLYVLLAGFLSLLLPFSAGVVATGVRKASPGLEQMFVALVLLVGVFGTAYICAYNERDEALFLRFVAFGLITAPALCWFGSRANRTR